MAAGKSASLKVIYVLLAPNVAQVGDSLSAALVLSRRFGSGESFAPPPTPTQRTCLHTFTAMGR